MKTDPKTREQDAMRLLDDFPWDSGASIIGGYSVLAYGTLRHSNDLDLIMLRHHLWKFGDGLKVEDSLRLNMQPRIHKIMMGNLLGVRVLQQN
ncbi:MAG: hypothetical protein M1477_05055 [Candidatus Thermoplasmatota archaeon]|nr:hypothetical protein [Candidatus Thermoplasmatota archaeon]